MTVVQVGARSRSRAARRSSARRSSARANTTAWLVMFPVGVLLAGGLMMILSASSVAAFQRYGSSFPFFFRQLAWAAGGILAMLAVSRMDYRRWRRLGYGLYALSMAGLVAVFVPGLGDHAGGASRWLQIGPIRMQPSEMAKLGLILVAADLCVRKAKRLSTFRDVMLPLGLMAGAAGLLVLVQPDFGTMVVLALGVFVVLLVAGVPTRILGGMGLAGLSGGGLLMLAEGYRRARFFSFLKPFSDPLNAGYQSVQSMIALGSGGLFGVGLGASRQKWLYVPNAHTDFIFAIFGEEAGLVGTVAMVALFVFLAYAGIRVARRAPDAFGRLVAAGITGWLIGQAVINMGGVTGLLPITGVPLPLVSFGGSALIFSLAGIGILINIARQEVWPPPGSSARRERSG